MDSRRRNKLVTFKSPPTTLDELNQPIGDWITVVAGVRADIRFLRGLEAIKGGAETSIGKASINVAYRTNLTTAMRVEYGSTVFEIKSIQPDVAGRTGVDLVCEVIQ